MAGTGHAHLRPAGDDIVLRADDLVVDFPIGRTGLVVSAVAGISLDVRRGETLGIVGESGCGKTTTGRAIMQLPPPTSGSVRFEGTDLTALGVKQMRAARTRMQMVFQDPISSLNPRRTARNTVLEPLAIHRRGTDAERAAIVDRTLEEVGIDPQRAAESRPHQLSGGQCQRISIARALVLDPTLIICDEPVSALDVSVQAQVLNLLEDLKAQAAVDPRLHRPRPRRGEEHQRPGGGDVPRQDVRGGPERGGVPRPGPSVHQRAAGVDPGRAGR